MWGLGFGFCTQDAKAHKISLFCANRDDTFLPEGWFLGSWEVSGDKVQPGQERESPGPPPVASALPWWGAWARLQFWSWEDPE